jgi:hypothetical protein
MTSPAPALRPGEQLASTVCTTGGRPPASGNGPNADGDAAATLIGKRYTDAAETVELLCTSSGAGALSCDGAPMTVKAAKPLPASD